jgi:hypothetical protein
MSQALHLLFNLLLLLFLLLDPLQPKMLLLLGLMVHVPNTMPLLLQPLTP